MIAVKKMGKTVRYFPADMNHRIVIDKARKNEEPIPNDFKGVAFTLFSK